MSSRRKKQAIAVLSASTLCGLLLAGVLIWRFHAVTHRSNLAHTEVHQALAEGDTEAARSALKGLTKKEHRTSLEREIRKEELIQALAVRDVVRAEQAMGSDAAEFIPPDIREEAAMLLARRALSSGHDARYRMLRDEWAPTTKHGDQWFLIEADRIIQGGRFASARAFLSKRKLTGKADALRLARLALLNTKEPQEAMKLINAGLVADPGNAELLSFRAQLLDAAGQSREARIDYVSAIIADKENPFHRDALARYYLRRSNYQLAIDTWQTALEETNLGVYGVKSWFWSRLTGFPFQPSRSDPKTDLWVEVLEAAQDLEDGVYWSDELDDAVKLKLGQPNRMEWDWLKLIHHLQAKGICKETLPFLDPHDSRGISAAARAVAPELVAMLDAVCLAQLADPYELHQYRPELKRTSGHPFLEDFARWAERKMEPAAQKRFEQWLRKPEAVVGCFLATGWAGAAVALGDGERFQIPVDSPAWLDFSYARALQIQRNPSDVIAWLEICNTRSQASDLLLGELLLSQKRIEEGIARLREVAESGSELGDRAIWTLAITSLELGRAATAVRWVEKSPALRESARGLELLARAALLQGERAKAVAIYESIQEDSIDALLFLSKEAYARRDWATARTLTEKLIERHPDEPRFRVNLLRIERAAKEKA